MYIFVIYENLQKLIFLAWLSEKPHLDEKKYLKMNFPSCYAFIVNYCWKTTLNTFFICFKMHIGQDNSKLRSFASVFGSAYEKARKCNYIL